MPSIAFRNRDKGEAVRVIAGKYAGRKGWKHIGKGETDSQIYVILTAVSQQQPSKAVLFQKIIVLNLRELLTSPNKFWSKSQNSNKR